MPVRNIVFPDLRKDEHHVDERCHVDFQLSLSGPAGGGDVEHQTYLFR